MLAAEGAPVPAGVPVLLVHCATLAPLAVDAGAWDTGHSLHIVNGPMCHALEAHKQFAGSFKLGPIAFNGRHCQWHCHEAVLQEPDIQLQS